MTLIKVCSSWVLLTDIIKTLIPFTVSSTFFLASSWFWYILKNCSWLISCRVWCSTWRRERGRSCNCFITLFIVQKTHDDTIMICVCRHWRRWIRACKLTLTGGLSFWSCNTLLKSMSAVLWKCSSPSRTLLFFQNLSNLCRYNTESIYQLFSLLFIITTNKINTEFRRSLQIVLKSSHTVM